MLDSGGVYGEAGGVQNGADSAVHSGAHFSGEQSGESRSIMVVGGLGSPRGTKRWTGLQDVTSLVLRSIATLAKISRVSVSFTAHSIGVHCSD